MSVSFLSGACIRATVRGNDLGTRLRAAWLSSAVLPVPPDERCAGALESEDPGALVMMRVEDETDAVEEVNGSQDTKIGGGGR